MAATNYTPIQLYYSTTASAVPVNTNLAAGELAINTLDEKLYFKNSAGTVKLLASNASSSATVSSVAASVPAFLSISGSPITTTGTLAISYSGTALPVANGGTGLTSGTSGGVLAYTATGTLVSSGALAANALVIGGGAGVAPSTTTTGTGVLTFLGTPSSANLASAVTDETGSGSLVFGTSPTLNNPTVTNYIESVVAVGTVGASSTLALTNGTVQTATLTASTPCTFTMPTATSGKSFILKLTQAATGMTTATFTGVKWPGGTAPTITATASAVDVLTFVCADSIWYGNYAQAFA